MNKIEKHLPIRYQIMAILLGFLVLITLIMALSIELVTINYQNNDIIKNIKAQYNQLDTSLDSLVSDANMTVISCFNEDNFYKVISKKSESERNQTFQDIYNLEPLPSSLFQGISFYSNSQELFFATSSGDATLPPLAASLYQKVIGESNASHPLVYCLSTYNEYGEYLVVGKTISVSGQNPGVAFVFFNEDRISSLMSSIIYSGQSYLLDSESRIASSSKPEELGAIVFQTSEFGLGEGERSFVENFNNEKSFIYVNELTNMKSSYGFAWKIVSVQNYDSLFSVLNVSSIVLWSLAIVSLGVSIFFAFKVSHKVTKSINTLSGEVGTLTQAINSEGHLIPLQKNQLAKGDEICLLENNYHQMIEAINSLMEKNTKDLEEKRALELDSLQSQINPHFLYNTLDAISWMAKLNNEEDIEKLVMSLAKFYRLSLHSGDKIITIKEEVELTKHYLEIQQTRFKDRFNVEYYLDPALEDCFTLKLLLQPLVENAVKYGLPQNKVGLIFIKVTKEDNHVVYRVIDNGEGFMVPEDILSQRKKDTSKNGTGYGLYNVSERIRLEYGPQYGVKVISHPGEGTTVELTIPLCQ